MNKSKFIQRILLLLLTLILILTLLPGFMPAALAAEYNAASQQDMIDALNAGDAVKITTASDFTITGSITIPNNCTFEIGHAIIINGSDSLAINNGSIVINSDGGIFLNNGSRVVCGGMIAINSGGIIDIGNSSTVTNGGTIVNNNGGIISNNGRIDNTGTITNGGIISNGERIDNTGTITNGGIISNGGRIDNTGTITNDNQILNFGTITNGDTDDNGGSIINHRGSTIDNSGMIHNHHRSTIDTSGMITNSGTISNSYWIDNCGVITNNNGGAFNNNGGGTFTNYNSGTIINNKDCTIANYGRILNGDTTHNVNSTIDNSGTIISHSVSNIFNIGNGVITNNNGGMITNAGMIHSDGTVTNRENGRIDNRGGINSSGTFVNDGRINNYGHIGNDGLFANNGKFASNGTIYNNESGIFTGFSPTGSGSIHNSGTFTVTDDRTSFERLNTIDFLKIIGGLLLAVAVIAAVFIRLRNNTEIKISKKRHIIPLIECFILSYLLSGIVVTYTQIGIANEFLTHREVIIELIPLILCITGLIFHIILYSVLKKKYNFEMRFFLYGVGFTACCIAFLCHTLGGLYGPYGPFSPYSPYGPYERVNIIENLKFLFFYILPFTTFYYSYATLLQNKEKEIGRVTLCLTAITVLSFAVLIILGTINYQNPYIGIIPILFGLYLAYCLIYKKGMLSLRQIAWGSFILTCTMLFYGAASNLIFFITHF
ncbi:MAG: hypothetical protein FWE54_04600 [Methanimicrococcus sp.]|nr:hypothetical protein [Methanimicrococcus sp.]